MANISLPPMTEVERIVAEHMRGAGMLPVGKARRLLDALEEAGYEVVPAMPTGDED